MSNMARHHKALADAIELQIEALGLVIHSLKRQRDAHRSMQEFFTPPAVPFPPIVAPAPAGPDPDFEDAPPSGPDAPGEVAP